ncbi:D-alanyl-D-alanine carboxypeptidase [Acetobacteraceae bacterium H6797]|nr:D-alanyl-D-alanine carboxypeptidase [Acetobacteraceae bacterium H6797]
MLFIGSRACVSALAILFLCLFSLVIPSAARAQIGGERYSAFMQDAQTGEILLNVNGDEPRYPASLTKMMTLYLAFEALETGRMRANTMIPVSRHAANAEPSKLWLRAGSRIRATDAIMALVTKSANDAATALGEYLAGGTEADFGRMMTAKARALGMSRTTFRNASGLPDPRQRTTARDIATLSRRLIADFPERYAYFSASGFDWNGKYIPGHNRVLSSYDGADGIKTGYIRASGFNMAASAMRNGNRIVAVVFGGASTRERDTHIMALMDRGFDMLDQRGGGSNETIVAARRGMPSLVGTANAAPMVRPRDIPELARPQPRQQAARPAARKPATSRGNYAVQVGAYGDRASAQRAAAQAARAGGTARVEQIRSNGGRLWRARVTGLSADHARRLCRTMRGPCMVLGG